MRAILLLLIAANLLLFALWQGNAGEWLAAKREPWRLAQQIAPQDMRILPLASSASDAVTCMEFGGFAGADVGRVGMLLENIGSAATLTLRQTQEQAAYIVYLPPYRDKSDADRAAGILRRNGITDFFLILDESPLRLGISLGVFKSQEAAAMRLADLKRQGIGLARIGQRDTPITKTWYRFEGVGPEMQASLENIRKLFPNQELKRCIPQVAP